MSRLFKIQIIRPNFDNLYKKYEQISVSNQKKESRHVAIKVKGMLEGARIEDNITEDGGLLETGGIKNSSIRRNRTFLSSPKDNHLRIEKLKEKRPQKFWEKTLFQIIILLSAIATIISLFL